MVNFSTENVSTGSQYFVLVSRRKNHGESAIDVFHGTKIQRVAVGALKPAHGMDAEVALRIAQAVTCPIEAPVMEASYKNIIVIQHSQKIHDTIGVAVR